VWSGRSGEATPVSQARLSRLLGASAVVALDDDLGRAAGALLARGGTSDVLDAALVLIAADGDEILTSDIDDLVTLAAASGVHADLRRDLKGGRGLSCPRPIV
jgi:hypothetical protein